MLNVRMRHGNPLGTCGIVVQNNATLVADGCNFKGFGIAIMAFPKSHVELNGCIFQDNEIGVKVYFYICLCINTNIYYVYVFI